MKLVNTLVVAALATMLGAGCTVSDDTTTDGGPSDGAVTDTGGSTDTGLHADATPTDTNTSDVSSDAPSCGTCATAACSPEITACNAEASCKSGLDCFNDCTDSTCKNACLTNSKNPDGRAGNDKFADVVTCAVTNCATPCGLAP